LIRSYLLYYDKTVRKEQSVGSIVYLTTNIAGRIDRIAEEFFDHFKINFLRLGITDAPFTDA
jgi:hypothetical protein